MVFGVWFLTVRFSSSPFSMRSLSARRCYGGSCVGNSLQRALVALIASLWFWAVVRNAVVACWSASSRAGVWVVSDLWSAARSQVVMVVGTTSCSRALVISFVSCSALV